MPPIPFTISLLITYFRTLYIRVHVWHGKCFPHAVEFWYFPAGESRSEGLRLCWTVFSRVTENQPHQADENGTAPHSAILCFPVPLGITYRLRHDPLGCEMRRCTRLPVFSFCSPCRITPARAEDWIYASVHSTCPVVDTRVKLTHQVS